MPTLQEIEDSKTPNGGYTRETLANWGVSWPPKKGWKQELIRRNDLKMTDDTQPAAVGIHPREWEDDMRAENDRLRDELAELHQRIIADMQAENADLRAAAENHNAAWVAACDRIVALEADLATARAETAMAYEVAARKVRPIGLRGGSHYSTLFHECADRVQALTPAHATEALAADRKAVRDQALRDGYCLGFAHSAEGYNYEYPFDHGGTEPEHDAEWVADRERAILALIEKEGGNG